jgi:hypothetical protein
MVKPVIMKLPTVYSLSIAAAILFAGVSLVSARPIGFSEISLLVRANESEASIKDEVTQRKLLHPLTQPQQKILKSQGASDSLIQWLRNSNLAVPKDEAAAIEAADAREAKMRSTEQAQAGRQWHPHLRIFDVACGHPINLSQWGGLDYEIAFYSYRFAGEDHIQPAIIDQVGTRTVVSPLVPTGGISEDDLLTEDWYPTNGVRNWRYTPYNGRGRTLYNGRGDFRDTRSFDLNEVVGVSSYSVSRPLVVDWDNPVFFDGEPYTFYPVYGAGEVSLYYLCSSGDSVKLAVRLPGR